MTSKFVIKPISYAAALHMVPNQIRYQINTLFARCSWDKGIAYTRRGRGSILQCMALTWGEEGQLSWTSKHHGALSIVPKLIDPMVMKFDTQLGTWEVTRNLGVRNQNH